MVRIQYARRCDRSVYHNLYLNLYSTSVQVSTEGSGLHVTKSIRYTMYPSPDKAARRQSTAHAIYSTLTMTCPHHHINPTALSLYGIQCTPVQTKLHADNQPLMLFTVL